MFTDHVRIHAVANVQIERNVYVNSDNSVYDLQTVNSFLSKTSLDENILRSQLVCTRNKRTNQLLRLVKNSW